LYAKHYDVIYEGKRLVGTKLFYLDPMQLTDFGYQLISLSCMSSIFNVRSVLESVPGYYLLDTSDVRGQGGDALVKLSSLDFIESVDLSYIPISSYSYTSNG
jgi:hypothetical protein